MIRFLSRFQIFHRIFAECKEYNLPALECPSFVFFLMGLINMVAMVSTYFIARRYTEPEIVALMVIGVTLVILIIGHTITQSFDKLAQANKMKTEFVGVASHQLRTPLSAMRWTLNLLMEGRLGQLAPEQMNYITLIKESNERMIKLANDLLDVSRIEMGKVVLRPRQTNLYVLIQKTINDFMPLSKASNVNITLEASETLPNVYSDTEKVALVIQNLIDNAIKYTKGKGEVKIKAEIAGKCVKVSIQDSGVGIPQDQQKHVFQKFFRSDNVMKHQTVGTGLGLFIARSVVEESKGKIWFESKLGEGTTFYFTLPVYSL